MLLGFETLSWNFEFRVDANPIELSEACCMNAGVSFLDK